MVGVSAAVISPIRLRARKCCAGPGLVAYWANEADPCEFSWQPPSFQCRYTWQPGCTASIRAPSVFIPLQAEFGGLIYPAPYLYWAVET